MGENRRKLMHKLPSLKHHSLSEIPVSVVIPVFNEEKIIQKNLEILASFFDNFLGFGKWHFIVVDNGSKDRTSEIIAAFREKQPLTQSVYLPAPNYGEALKAGLKHAKTKYVYLLDIEQWDLPFIAWAWKNKERFDLFLASKRADPTLCFQAPYRKILSCGLNALLQLFLGFSGTDTHGPKLIHREALESIIHLCQLDRGQFDTELVLRALRSQMRIVEIPGMYQEMRPHRNWMIKKIIWNIFAFRRLVNVMKDVPYIGFIRFYRYTREDVLSETRDIQFLAE